ncbi:unnamed protein product [Closterium sp. NIES-54]
MSQSLELNQHYHVMHLLPEVDSGPKAWTVLKELHAPASVVATLMLERELSALRLSEDFRHYQLRGGDDGSSGYGMQWSKRGRGRRFGGAGLGAKKDDDSNDQQGGTGWGRGAKSGRGGKSGAGGKMKGSCWYCEKEGHPWFLCYKKPDGWTPQNRHQDGGAWRNQENGVNMVADSSDNNTKSNGGAQKKKERTAGQFFYIGEQSCIPWTIGWANRTILETARALLIESGVGNLMWPHAVRHATVARNRVLTKVGNESWVPLERWLVRKPPVDMLRVFGCMAVAHVSKKYRSKLGPSAIWCKQPETKVSQQMEQITMQLDLTPSVWEEGEEAAAEGGDKEKVQEAPAGGGDDVETSGSTKEAAGSEGGE